MKSHILCIFLLLVCVSGCSKKNETTTTPSDIWDIDKDGIPEFVKTNYIELNKIYRISRYRSSVGHDYSDSYEQCRSLKHYFEPKSTLDWSTVKIYSPVKGVITRAEQEWAGTKLEIASDDYPAFRFSIFHINTSKQYNVNDKVSEGEILGNHIGSQTYSDISVIVNDPARLGRMVSFFDVMTDGLFTEFSTHGLSSKNDVIITKSDRDANPLTCNGDTFTSTDILENWIYLK
ncbi:MAG: hypothetical protein LLG13_08180 [Bacteroidales bacterium]|nr:hypothetical protein [Bacteroidales bacterium]